jgi:hypothetical protein
MMNALTDRQRRRQWLQDAQCLLKTAAALLADARIRITRGAGCAVVRACTAVPYAKPPPRNGGVAWHHTPL